VALQDCADYFALPKFLEVPLQHCIAPVLELPPIGEKWIHLQGGHGMLDHLGSC
jgi:hypothetical protein